MLNFRALVLFCFASVVLAHPGEANEHLDYHEITARQIAANERHLLARNCLPQIARDLQERKAKRAVALKRSLPEPVTEEQAAAAACVTAPEVTEGPYYINNELIRANLIESQPGVKLILDISVIDTSTCTAIPNAFVELWSTNATGVYGGYNGATSGSQALINKETFARGGLATNSAGVAEITTVYPGFYTGRTAHIHAMVHLNYTINSNGTFVSHSGTLAHIGQIFFEESWNDQVYALPTYAANKQTRTRNVNDGIYTQANANGNDAVADLSLLGSTVANGVLGYITFGVSKASNYRIQNAHYLSGL